MNVRTKYSGVSEERGRSLLIAAFHRHVPEAPVILELGVFVHHRGTARGTVEAARIDAREKPIVAFLEPERVGLVGQAFHREQLAGIRRRRGQARPFGTGEIAAVTHRVARAAGERDEKSCEEGAHRKRSSSLSAMPRRQKKTPR